MRSLMTYGLDELFDLAAQGAALLPTLSATDAARMTDLLASIQGEIADRRGQENLAALACGYDADGGRLDAKTCHTFARVR